MTHPIRAVTSLLAVLLLSVAFAACGGDDEAEQQPAGEGGGGETTEQSANLIESDPANEGKEFTVGSKNFAEQYVLGEIYAQALEAAGFTVRKQLDLGSEQVAYRQLKRGNINGYPEYSGTALTSFYRVKIDDIPRDPQESYEQLRDTAAEEDNITALPQTPFQNTYVVTSTTETAEELGNPETISELAEKAGSDMSISGFPECRQRTDCLLGLNETYNWEPEFVSSEGQYEDLDQGQADFTFGFSTDGSLALDKYATYEDDKQLFPPYYVTFLVNEDGMEALGESGQQVIEQVQEPLTEEVMRELNSRVQIDKQEPEQVARDYLREAGFTE
jgi:glycine betaine/choline ABC-type transport system substrate-binding protein